MDYRNVRDAWIGFEGVRYRLRIRPLVLAAQDDLSNKTQN
jgi:hypothetical protein